MRAANSSNGKRGTGLELAWHWPGTGSSPISKAQHMPDLRSVLIIRVIERPYKDPGWGLAVVAYPLLWPSHLPNVPLCFLALDLVSLPPFIQPRPFLNPDVGE